MRIVGTEMGADRLRIPMDTPLEDNLGSLMRQLGQSLPRTAEFERNETGRGEQKISIGGRQYYCSWLGYELVVAEGFDRAVFSGRTWRCLDVPLDGIVRAEHESPFMRMKGVLLDSGVGGKSL